MVTAPELARRRPPLPASEPEHWLPTKRLSAMVSVPAPLW
jgi:hypothetical protein